MTRILMRAVFIFFLAHAAVSPAYAQDSDAAAQAPATPIGPPAPGKAQIVFYRAREFLGSALTYPVLDNRGEEIGRLANGRYFILTVAPGNHSYDIDKYFHENVVVTIPDVAANQTYYIKVSVRSGLVGIFPGPVGTDMVRSSDLEFEKVAAKLTLYSPHE